MVTCLCFGNLHELTQTSFKWIESEWNLVNSPTDLSFPVSLTCISLKLQMLVHSHPHLHLGKKKRNATTFLSLTHSQTLFSFPNLFGDSLVFSKQGSYTSLSYYTKEETWLFNKAWLSWHCSISLWLVLTGTDVTTRITATTRSNRFLENDFFSSQIFP